MLWNGAKKEWCRVPDFHWGRQDFQSCALLPELTRQILIKGFIKDVLFYSNHPKSQPSIIVPADA